MGLFACRHLLSRTRYAAKSKLLLNYSTKSAPDTFMAGTAAHYIEGMWEAWRKDPQSVHASWQVYFSNLQQGIPSQQAFSLAPAVSHLARDASVGVAPTQANLAQQVEEHMRIQLMVRAYQARGHLKSRLDPLGINQPADHQVPELDPAYYGFTEADLERPFWLGAGVLPAFRQEQHQMTLKEIIRCLQHIYCGSVGYEYMHIPSRAQCDWLRARIEVPEPYSFSRDERLRILDRLIWADSFERFVATKYPGEKRFGLEGGEALIPGMKALVDRAVERHGVEQVVMGMAHRGRLNVLSNVVRKPHQSLFCEFSGVQGEATDSSGDVKYHLGMSYDRPTPGGKRVQLSLVANPSHLEAVDPVVLGKVRALQQQLKTEDATGKVMPLLVHGDAAFAGQGVVYETLGMSQLPGYRVGGCIHVILNNQIGFTTDPRFARSSPYCSDVAKTIDAPVLHVNGDDVEAVVHACHLAADWRDQFQSDVVVDLVCYRKHGHNEVDQPAFTQPRMYAAIAQKRPVLDLYADRLVESGCLTANDLEDMRKRVWSTLEADYAGSKTYVPTSREWLTSTWPGFKSPKELRDSIAPARPTGVAESQLKALGERLVTLPKDFDPHPGIQRILEGRARMVETGHDLDMGMAEALAFATLLQEGIHVRLSGQDVERGTFSHRHALLHSQSREVTYTPLSHVDPKQAAFTVCNSSLSEFGVLGFELGYSLVSPLSLVLWEAQFGDFANNAQCIIDQFLASGERKWLQRSGLVMMLPHGYDGAGPEHSNARLERFLTLCDDHPYRPQPSDDADVRTRQAQDCNWQIVMPSTPANLFHALRRQIHRDFRKPLILFNSKSLLRHPMARSSLADLSAGTRFSKLYPEANEHIDAKGVERVILCSGQVYYALVKARDANRLTNTAIIRVEQLSPFPYDQVVGQLDRYTKATDIVWCQEEPMNLGAWTYVEPRLESILKLASKHHAGKRARYAGRDPTAAVATGFKKQHVKEELNLLSTALLGEAKTPKSVETGTPLW